MVEVILEKLLKNIYKKIAALLYKLLQVIIDLDFFFFVFIIDSIGLQNPKDWEFSLAHISDDSIQLFQPLTFKQHVQDEAEDFEHHIQPCSDLYSQ